jgi:para-aminobenzoate synthetase component 1
MSPESPTSCTIIKLPYRTDSAHYVEQLLHLPECIFLDSGYPDCRMGRYDIFSAAPLYTLRYSSGILHHTGKPAIPMDGRQLTQYLNQLLLRHQSHTALTANPAIPFQGGFAGYFSYDLARCWEKIPGIATKDIAIPELLLGFYPWAGVIDHLQKEAWLCFLPECPAELQTQIVAILESTLSLFNGNKFKLINKLKSNINVNSYKFGISAIQGYIANGDCYQVNYAQRFSARYEGHPWQAYQRLRETMPAPFGAYFQFKPDEHSSENAILSYSPERFVSINGQSVLTQPIKGTAPRHHDPVIDSENARALFHSEKNRAENLMIVDLLRNDLGKCCEFGSIKTDKLFGVQSVSNVHHLVSSISGQLRDDQTAFDLLQAILPGGSITGAPKIRAMQIIEELEPQRRSIYCGAIGYININGDMDTNIAIRTVLCSNNQVYCWGGGGIVADSEWEAEYNEINSKISRLINGLESIS